MYIRIWYGGTYTHCWRWKEWKVLACTHDGLGSEIRTYVQTDTVRQYMLVIIHTHPQVCTTCSTAYQHLVHITYVCTRVSPDLQCADVECTNTREHKWARCNRSSLSLGHCQTCTSSNHVQHWRQTQLQCGQTMHTKHSHTRSYIRTYVSNVMGKWFVLWLKSQTFLCEIETPVCKCTL